MIRNSFDQPTNRVLEMALDQIRKFNRRHKGTKKLDVGSTSSMYF
jgi:hypothetical protein